MERWSSQGVKVWWEDRLLLSGDCEINSNSGETVMEGRRDREHYLPVFQPGVVATGGPWYKMFLPAGS